MALRPRNPDQIMETTTPFDLNRAIQEWRNSLARSPALHSENLAELESHLRDSISELLRARLSSEEAFLIAARRVGQGDALDREFRKVNSGAILLERASWLLAGFLLTMMSFDVARIAQTSLAVPAVVFSGFANWGAAQQMKHLLKTCSTDVSVYYLILMMVATIVIGVSRRFGEPSARIRSVLAHFLRRPTLLAIAVIMSGMLLRFLTAVSVTWNHGELTSDGGLVFYPILYNTMMQMPLYLWGALLALIVARKRLQAATHLSPPPILAQPSRQTGNADSSRPLS